MRDPVAEVPGYVNLPRLAGAGLLLNDVLGEGRFTRLGALNASKWNSICCVFSKAKVREGVHCDRVEGRGRNLIADKRRLQSYVLHAAYAVKSPLSIACVGTNAEVAVGFERARVAW